MVSPPAEEPVALRFCLASAFYDRFLFPNQQIGDITHRCNGKSILALLRPLCEGDGPSHYNRWGIKYAPEFEKQFRRRQRPVGRSWRLDEAYVKIKGKWPIYTAP